jgi:hypothetical protein
VPVERTITIPANTSIQVRITDPLTSKTAKANDHFHGTVAAVVFADGALAIPVGTPVLGRVVSAKPAGHFIAEAKMALEITTLRLPQLDGKSRDVPVVTLPFDPLEQSAAGIAPFNPNVVELALALR